MRNQATAEHRQHAGDTSWVHTEAISIAYMLKVGGVLQKHKLGW